MEKIPKDVFAQITNTALKTVKGVKNCKIDHQTAMDIWRNSNLAFKASAKAAQVGQSPTKIKKRCK